MRALISLWHGANQRHGANGAGSTGSYISASPAGFRGKTSTRLISRSGAGAAGFAVQSRHAPALRICDPKVVHVRPVGGWSMAIRIFMSVLAVAAVLVGNAAAQQAPQQGPSVGPGWRYEKRGASGGPDLHVFHCQQPHCVPPSAVSYRLYAPNTTMTLEQFRREQEEIVRALEQRAAPGTRITVLEIKGDEGSGPPRMFVTRRVTEQPNGTREFRVSSTLLGVSHSATLISTSPDEKAATANHSMFVIAVMLFINQRR